MTTEEWLQLGIDNNILSAECVNEISNFVTQFKEEELSEDEVYELIGCHEFDSRLPVEVIKSMM